MQLLLRASYVALAISLLASHCFSQAGGRININIRNGLPSDNVYNLVVDKHGYLWAATDKGVAWYNGYNLNDIDLSRGFIYKDIWNLYEDKRGRMWLYSVTDRLGYIYNGKYHAVTYTGEEGTFYPRGFIKDYSGGVYFLCLLATKANGRRSLFCIESNDSLRAYDITRFGDIGVAPNDSQLVTIDQSEKVNYLLLKNGVVKCLETKAINKERITGKSIPNFSRARWFWFGNHFICYNGNGKFFLEMEADSCVLRKFCVDSFSSSHDGEQINAMNIRDSVLNVITSKHVYSFDEKMMLIEENQLTGIDSGDKVVFCGSYPFWGNTIGTSNSGFYITYPDDSIFKAINDISLAGYSYLGNVSDTITLWWSSRSRSLAKIENNHKISFRKESFTDVTKAIYYGKDSVLLFSLPSVSFVDLNTLLATSFMEKDITDAVIADNKFFAVSRSTGLFMMPDGVKGSREKVLDNDFYKGLVCRSTDNTVIAHNFDKVLIYKSNGQLEVLKSDQLEEMGLNSIEQILADPIYGNIFVKEERRVMLWEDYPHSCKVVIDNKMLKNAIVTLNRDKLVIAGAFGVVFCKINGPGQISAPVLRANTKGIKYSTLYDFQVSGNQLLLNTDKGVLLIEEPNDTEFGKSKSQSQKNKLVISYNGKLIDADYTDTIVISQEDTRLQFDLICPDGIGKVRYKYRVGPDDTNWHELVANEIMLQDLRPGKTSLLSVMTHDEQWYTNTSEVCMYVVPYWYQKPLGKALLWISGLVFILGGIYVTASVSRRNVVRANEKRNRQLELELKSVYAQINPHFIFNSLSVAMYLVKTQSIDTAYKHIYKFSQLLRAYIKSSRNRFITLHEEITNLTNYIELQQARFSNRFGFEIVIGAGVNTGLNIPSLLLQPLVENAIGHGLLPNEKKGHLLIAFSKEPGDGSLTCTIEDDGIGRERSMQMRAEHNVNTESFGGALITDLISVLNKYEQVKITIDYTDKLPPLTGTIVSLNIKRIT